MRRPPNRHCRCRPGVMPFHRAPTPSSRATVATVPNRPLRRAGAAAQSSRVAAWAAPGCGEEARLYFGTVPAFSVAPCICRRTWRGARRLHIGDEARRPRWAATPDRRLQAQEAGFMKGQHVWLGRAFAVSRGIVVASACRARSREKCAKNASRQPAASRCAMGRLGRGASALCRQPQRCRRTRAGATAAGQTLVATLLVRLGGLAGKETGK